MFYTYKIRSFEGKCYYYFSKDSIFRLVDDFGVRSFKLEFCNDFIVGSKSGILHSYQKKPHYYYFEGQMYEDYDHTPVYRSGNYIIRNYAGQIVDIETLVAEYCQSRNIYNKKKNKAVKHKGSKKRKYSPKGINRYFSGIKNEFSQNLIDESEGFVKIRGKRKNAVKRDYDYEFYRENTNSVSWKCTNKNKQWM